MDGETQDQAGGAAGQAGQPSAHDAGSAPVDAAPEASPGAEPGAEGALAGEGDKQDSGTRVEAAMRRARARLEAGAPDDSGEGGDTDSDTNSDDEGNAGEAGAAASSPTPDDAGAEIAAPEHWPESWKAEFAALPDTKARELVLSMHGELARATTQANEEFATMRKGREALDAVLQESGLDDAAAVELVQMQSRFSDEPMAVIEELAKQAGIEVFFSPPESEEVPDFEDKEQLAEWLAKRESRVLQRAMKQVSEKQARELAEAQRAQEQREALREIKAEIEAAKTAHGEDFAKAWPKVQESLQKFPALPVESHYRLAQHEALTERVSQLEAALAKAENTAQRSESERAGATRPPAARGPGDVADAEAEAKLSPAERALRRARRRLQRTA